MDWKRGYSAKYYMTFVDPDSWKDGEIVQIIDGTIQRTLENLRESASVTCGNYEETRERIIRVWLDTIQEGSISHTPLFTGYATTPSRSINGRKETKTLDCYSVLKPADDIYLDRGWYAAAKVDGPNVIKSLLSVIGTPIEIDQTEDKKRVLKQAIIAEEGETRLTMTEKILDVIGWRLKINGLGEISVAPFSKIPIAKFDSIENDVIEPSLTVTYDWYSCPNVFRAVYGTDVAIYKDEDTKSLFSIPGRGREVWAEETSCALNDGETLKAYAKRRLEELQKVSTIISYDRRYDPDIYPTDVITLGYPEQEISGNFMVSSQTINLGFNGRTSEEVIKI